MVLTTTRSRNTEQQQGRHVRPFSFVFVTRRADGRSTCGFPICGARRVAIPDFYDLCPRKLTLCKRGHSGRVKKQRENVMPRNHSHFLAALAAAIVFAIPSIALAQSAPPTNTGCTAPDPDLANPPLGTQGTNAYAGGGDAYALGNNAAAEGLRDFAIGTNSFAGGSVTGVSTACDYAIGDTAIAEGYRDLAVGVDSYANGTSSVAVGDSAAAIGNQALAIGTLSTATANASVAIGSGATATTAGGVALGGSSYADRGEAVSIGSDVAGPAGAFQRQIIGLAAGTLPFDAVNLTQLDAGGSAMAAWMGGGAAFDAAGSGAFTAPTFVLANPYTPGSYTTVSGALTALDTAITKVSKQPGPVGPAGPGGKNGTGGSGTDPLAVHYDTAADANVTLHGSSGTQVHNLTAGVAPTDAANVSQIEEALRSANAYTDIRSIDTLNQANAYTDMRIGQLDLRVNYALAAATANANAAAAVAAQDPNHRNRVAVSDGLASGVNAWTFMYQHLTESGVTWNASLTGEQGGGSSSERQVGVGVGYSW